MKKDFLLLFLVSLFFIACNNNKKEAEMKNDNKTLASLFENYYNERMQLIPIESTQNGDTTNNDKLFADFTDSYREKYKEFYGRYLTEIKKYNRDDLSENDKISYDIFKREMEITLEGLSLGWFANLVTYPDHQYIPFNQFGGIPITLGQLGSGEGSQPFKNIKDYDDWLKRASVFSAWTDSAIIYFRKGIDANIVLPQPLVKKMIHEMNGMLVNDATKSLFYGPVNKIPNTFGDNDRKRISADLVKLIKEQLI